MLCIGHASKAQRISARLVRADQQPRKKRYATRQSTQAKQTPIADIGSDPDFGQEPTG